MCMSLRIPTYLYDIHIPTDIAIMWQEQQLPNSFLVMTKSLPKGKTVQHSKKFTCITLKTTKTRINLVTARWMDGGKHIKIKRVIACRYQKKEKVHPEHLQNILLDHRRQHGLGHSFVLKHGLSLRLSFQLSGKVSSRHTDKTAYMWKQCLF